ncbi:MAG: type IV toxin-antitoxin system AbiEi family antitoxin domain-containing protein [Nitrosotalea sp.]
MITQNIRFGSQEARLLFGLEEKGMSVFTFSDAKKILGSTDSGTWNVLEGLKKKKRVQQIEKGKYLLVPARAGVQGYWAEEAWVVVAHLIDVYYVGFWTAMNYWAMTEQIPRTVFVVTTKRKRDLEFGGQKFKFVTLSQKKFFGYVQERRGSTKFNISGREKTIVDGLMHPQYCGGISEVTKAMWNSNKKVDWSKVLEMSRKVKTSVVLRRLGYLLSLLEIQKNTVNEIKKESFGGYQFLDPTGDKARLDYSKEFGLILNLTSDELMSWMRY